MPKISVSAPVSAIQDVHVTREEFNKVKDAVDKLTEIKDPVMYAFVNKGLNLIPGKVAAQALHAQEELFTEIMEYAPGETRRFHLNCAKRNPRTVIVLEVKNTDELYKVENYLRSCEIRTGIYVDEQGENYRLEPTAMVTQYLDKSDPRIEKIFGMFDLYKPEDFEEQAKYNHQALVSVESRFDRLYRKYVECERENNRLKYELDCLKDRGLFARIINR